MVPPLCWGLVPLSLLVEEAQAQSIVWTLGIRSGSPGPSREEAGWGRWGCGRTRRHVWER